MNIAFRKPIDIWQLKKIGQGKSAEVFDLGDGQLLKLFFPGREDYLRRELQYHPVIEQMRLPVMQLDQVVKIGGRSGLLFHGAFIGSTIGQILKRAPWRVTEMAHLLADLHARIHENNAVGLPTFKSKLITEIELDYELLPSDRSKILMLLDQLPDENSLCHGDFHMDNIIVSHNKYLIIDWSRWCSQGSAICDVCKTIACLQYENHDFPFIYRKAQRPIRLFLAREYLSHYVKGMRINPSSITEHFKAIDIIFRLNKGNKTREKAITDLRTM